VITGERVELSFSDWQYHVRRMCDDERSKMLGEVALGWTSLGAMSTLKDLKFCFEAGTPVLTDQGFVSIEDIRIGDRVLSMDEKTGELSYREVVRVFTTPDQPLYELKLTDGSGVSETFHATEAHPFYVKGEGWTRAAGLLPGDEVFTSLGGWLRVSGGTWTDRRAAVYNIEVDGTHTYFVGRMQAWVHNVCAGTSKSATIAEPGGLNLFKWKHPASTRATGWKEGDYFLHLPNQGSTKANWIQNSSRLRAEMRKGNPIFDPFRDAATGQQITTPGFLNAERNLLETHGWRYNPQTGAYHPLGG
jgi:hypothetical protein